MSALKKLYAVLIQTETDPKGGNAFIWSSQEDAEKHAKQLVLANRKDVIVYEMTAKARMRIAGVDREDLTEEPKDRTEIVEPKSVPKRTVKSKTKTTVPKPVAKPTKTKKVVK